ncbi:MAG: hypothetical protein M3M88_04695, partial [Thermoproteota archaeon]|nr:hypothetical protein [Thermoproteota archaeon]
AHLWLRHYIEKNSISELFVFVTIALLTKINAFCVDPGSLDKIGRSNRQYALPAGVSHQLTLIILCIFTK